MPNHARTTSQDRSGPESYRTTARVVGVIYLAGMVLGVGGNVLVQSILGAPDYLATLSANSMLVAIGAMLWLLPAAGDVAHGILMFPVLRRHSERVAIGYLGARIVDAVFVGLMALFILLQIPLGSAYLKEAGSDASLLQALSDVLVQAQLYAYHFGMITVGFAGTMLSYLSYRTRLLPRALGVWGLVGYATILCGSVLEVLGVNLALIHTLPGGLWELFVGVWLIARGFSPSVGGSPGPAWLRLGQLVGEERGRRPRPRAREGSAGVSPADLRQRQADQQDDDHQQLHERTSGRSCSH